MKFNIKDIAEAVKAAPAGIAADCEVDELMIDSRGVVNPATTLFVALTTANNDGHSFIPGLIERGVKNFVVQYLPENLKDSSGVNFLVVEDTLGALQAIGSLCRDRISAPVVAVTGSRGKTFVKECIYAAFDSEAAASAPVDKSDDAKGPTGNARFTVSRSPRSYNSQIGVPLSLWQCNQEADLVVIEAGISTTGEMERLSTIIRPNIGILTAITAEHDGGFASTEEKIAEKIKLFATCDTIIYNADDHQAGSAIKKAYPGKQLVGLHLGRCDTASCNHGYVEALANVLCKNDTPKFSIGACCSISGINTRLDLIDGVNGCRIVYDRFTADIVSLRVALDFIHRRAWQSENRTLVLAATGFAGRAGTLVGELEKYGFSRLILVGSGMDGIPERTGIKIERVNVPEELTADDFCNEAVLVKDTPHLSLAGLYSVLEAKQHETLMEVNLDAVVSNFNFFRSKVNPSTGIICMLKADGYGAGSVELARTLQAQGAAYLAVAVVDEGVELRRAGITMPIIVLNPRAQNYRLMFDFRLEPEVYTLEMLDEIISSAEKLGVEHFPVHIKLETGMRRLGFVKEELPHVAARLNATGAVKASTVFSHLACADDPAEDDYTRGQFACFAECCGLLDSLLTEKPRRHILNSTGIVRFPQYQFDFVRLGIGLYGIPTLFDGSMEALRNVSSLTSPIISLKHWPAGTTVGYNRRGRLTRDSVIATVPVGYADGIDRHLGYGNARFIVNGKQCPTVGSICMDICMIDVTGVECAVGSRVEIFGDNVSPIILANQLSTIPYEILTSISPRVKRVYYREA